LDLALQMHGSGEIVNPLVESFGARHTVGFTRDDPHSTDFVCWPQRGHEIERMLELTDALGVPRCGVDLEFPLRDSDRHGCAAKFPQLRRDAYAIVHPGAQLPSRRWPRDRFAAVAAAIEHAGLRVAVTGTAGEAGLTRTVTEDCARATDLAGRTTLWDLAALIENASLIVCNDTGVGHIAAAFGTPSVIVSCGSDVSRWAPLDSSRHRVVWAQTLCRPCSYAVCPTRHECATAIDVASVLREVEHLRETAHA
jgi:ADP-heptose:LPS heptosyltransferase